MATEAGSSAGYVLRPEVDEFVSRPLHQMFVGGGWTAGTTDETIEAISLSDGRSLGKFPAAGADDVDRTVAVASAAFAGPWGRMLSAERERHLRRFAELLEQDAAALAEIESLDNGKPVANTRRIDTPVAARLAFMFAGWPTKIAGETPAVSAPGFLAYTLRRAIGVVAAIIPWNYPLIHTAQKIMPALACGNTVILKPSEKASLVSLRMAELAARADLPPGVLNVLTGDGPTTGAAMAAHPGIHKIAFTGSVATGRTVMRSAADSIKRVSLELGNKGANIVFADADLDVAIPRSFAAAFGNSGQSCVAGSRLFVQDEVHDRVVSTLIELAAHTRIGHALDPATTFGPIVDQGQMDAIVGYIDTGRSEGATVRCGGSRLSEGALAEGHFLEPTIFTDVHDSMTVAREEIFGPVLTVHRFSSEEEAVRRANDTPYGLASAVWTKSVDRAHLVAADLETGVAVIDAFGFHLATRIVWHSPFTEAAPAEVAALGGSRVLIVTDPGIAATGLLAATRTAIEGGGAAVATYAEVKGNPTTDDVAAARTAATEAGSDVIVALGGGSVIDTAKAAAMLLANGGEYADYQWSGKPIVHRSHPLIAIPTTAGTGSEVSKVAVIGGEADSLKKGVLSPLMFAHVALIDPEVTVGRPPHLTAATGIDAFSHALEAFVGKRPSPLTDLLALEALRLTFEYLPRATTDGEDLEARSRMMLAALYGGIAMDHAGLGLIHALSGGLCGHFPLHHGRANAMLLPHVFAYNAPVISPDRMRRLAGAFGLSPQATAAELVGTLTEFTESLGLPVGLTDLPDRDVDWDAIAADSVRMVMIANNPRPATVADCRRLLEEMRLPPGPSRL